MNKLKAIIFDVDGTFADTERDGHRVAFNHAFANEGLDWFWDERMYGELLSIGGGRERIEGYIRFYRNEIIDPDLVTRLHLAKADAFTQLIADGAVPLRPGVARIIHDAKQAGVLVAAATNCSHASLTALTQRFFDQAADTLFDVCITGDLLLEKKPAPEAYLKALAGLGLDASECVAFEDSHMGLTAAKAAGLTTIVTLNKYTEREDVSAANMVLNQLGEPEVACDVVHAPQGIAPFTYVDLNIVDTVLSN